MFRAFPCRLLSSLDKVLTASVNITIFMSTFLGGWGVGERVGVGWGRLFSCLF